MDSDQEKFSEVCRLITKRKDLEAIKMLTQDKKLFFELNGDFQSLLHVATNSRNQEIIKFLLSNEYGLRMKELKDANNERPIDIARRKSLIDIESQLDEL